MSVDAAYAIGARFAIAVDVAYRPYEESISGISHVAFQTYHILVNLLIDEQIRRADYAIRLDVQMTMSTEDGLPNLIRAAENAVHQHWPELKRAASLDGLERLGH